MSAFPRWGALCEFDQGSARFGRAGNPGFERLPILCRDGDNGAVEHFGFSGFESFAAHEVAETGVRLFGCSFEDGPFSRVNPDAQDRSGWCVYHVYDISTHLCACQNFSLVCYREGS